jgi:hypothetical protein
MVQHLDTLKAPIGMQHYFRKEPMSNVGGLDAERSLLVARPPLSLLIASSESLVR